MGALSRSAARRARQAQWARAMCGGLGAALATVGAAVYGGATLGDLELLGLALAVGSAASFTWHRSHQAHPRRVMERVDERLHLGGAFLAAQESCEVSPDSTITQLGAAKLLMRVKPNQVMEAAIPHTLGFTLLPLVALLGLVQAVGVRDARAVQSEAVNVEVARVVERLEDIEERLGPRMTPEESALLDGAQEAAKEAASQASGPAGASAAAREPEDGAAEDSAPDWRAKLRDVAGQLDDLAQSVTPGSELERELSDAAAEAEVLAMEDGGKSPDGKGSGSLDTEQDSARAADEIATDPGAEGLGDAPGFQPPTGPASLGPQAPGDGIAQGPGEFGTNGAPEDQGIGDPPVKVGPGEDPGAGSQPASTTVAAPEPPGTAGEARADPEQQAGEALKGRPRWWPSRHDGIVRAWAAGG